MIVCCGAMTFGLLVATIIGLMFPVVEKTAWAETTSQETPTQITPKRGRNIDYEPAGAIRNQTSREQTAQTQVTPQPVPRHADPQRNQTITYAPAGARDVGVDHRVARPVTDASSTSVAVTASQRDGTRSFQRELSNLLDELPDDPIGPITDMDARKQLDRLNQMNEAAKTGGTIPSDANSDTNTDTSTGNNVPSGGLATVQKVAVQQIFQLEDGGWFALKEGSKIPIPLVKGNGQYYLADENGNALNEVFIPNTDAGNSTVADNADTSTAKSEASDKTRNAVMLIVTTIAVLVALSIGFLAFDYKYRWEQEVAGQNSRLLGGTGSGSPFSEHDSFEPETLSFLSNDYGSLDSLDSTDHSFRTIA